MSFKTIVVEVNGPAATIILNRPQVRNAQNELMKDEISSAIRKLEGDTQVRVIILKGEGLCFSAGHDLKQLPRDPEDFAAPAGRPWFEGDEEKFRAFTNKVLRTFLELHDCSKPTIAQVHGACIAAGWVLASMCDLIVAAEDATFSDPVLRMATAGVEVLVEPWDLGIRRAKQLMWTGDAITAREAWQVGMVNLVVPGDQLDRATMDLARRIALTPPGAVRATKRSINRALDLMGWRASHEQHTEVWVATMRSNEHREAHERRASLGLKQFLQERDSKYT